MTPTHSQKTCQTLMASLIFPIFKYSWMLSVIKNYLHSIHIEIGTFIKYSFHIYCFIFLLWGIDDFNISDFSFIVKDWGECSVPCGEGIRVRDVQCQIFLEFSKTVANLPDDKCPGPKPITTEICYAGLCDTRTAPLKEKGNYQSEKEVRFGCPSRRTNNNLIFTIIL